MDSSTFFGHDEGGRRIEDGSTRINYTAFDLPQSVLRGGTVVERYTYDAAGRRVARISSTETTLYHGDLYELRRSPGANGAVSVAHVMGPNGVVASIVLRPGRGPQSLYHHRDLLGSASVITGNGAAVVERQFFEPFGASVDENARPITRAASAIDDGFTGHSLDRATGYVNANGRMYDPRTRRFLTTDPLAGIGGSQSWNPFSYVANNPSTMNDPSGFTPARVRGGQQGGRGTAPVGSGSGRGTARVGGGGAGGRSSDSPVRLTGGPTRIDDASAGAQSRTVTVFDRIGVTPEQIRTVIVRGAELYNSLSGRPSTAPFPTEAAIALAEATVFFVGCSATPGCGELLDGQTLADSNAPLWARGLAALSLTVSAVTFGEGPNFGAYRRAEMMLDTGALLRASGDIPQASGAVRTALGTARPVVSREVLREALGGSRRLTLERRRATLVRGTFDRRARAASIRRYLEESGGRVSRLGGTTRPNTLLQRLWRRNFNPSLDAGDVRIVDTAMSEGLDILTTDTDLLARVGYLRDAGHTTISVIEVLP